MGKIIEISDYFDQQIPTMAIDVMERCKITLRACEILQLEEFLEDVHQSDQLILRVNDK